MKNSPRPWKALSAKDGFDPCIIDAAGNYVSMAGDEMRQHITKCVNACAGMDDPVIEVQRLNNIRAAALLGGRPLTNNDGALVLDFANHVDTSELERAVEHSSAAGFRTKTDYSNFPAEPSWHELGILPPVGTECEMLWSASFTGDPEWKNGVVIAIAQELGEKNVIFQAEKCWRSNSSAALFRPIQTEKQKTIKAMLECFDNFFSEDGPTDNVGDACEKIYDQFIAKK